MLYTPLPTRLPRKLKCLVTHFTLNSTRTLRKPIRIMKMGAAIRKKLPDVMVFRVRKTQMPPKTMMTMLNE